MKRWITGILFLMSLPCLGQSDTLQLRAFPITDYIVSLNDSVKVVQVELPEGMSIPEKQLGVAYGVYQQSKDDAVAKGYGRCYLIKGAFHYFAIGNNQSGKELQEGDLVYVHYPGPEKTEGRLPKLAAHFIRLLDVYDKPFYDRYLVFNNWTAASEKNILDSMIRDIRFTGDYFRDVDPSQNKIVASGLYQGKRVLDVLAACQVADLYQFLDYVIARPRNYAGKSWKVSETFATWVNEGAPIVVK